ncbi:hypothetical protein D3C78_1706170 [compost metagenome]
MLINANRNNHCVRCAPRKVGTASIERACIHDDLRSLLVLRLIDEEFFEDLKKIANCRFVALSVGDLELLVKCRRERKELSISRDEM